MLCTDIILHVKLKTKYLYAMNEYHFTLHILKQAMKTSIHRSQFITILQLLVQCSVTSAVNTVS